ncbi:MAG TPA: pantetheine-phosphate adenylyltransferase [Myxococcota bacterium]|nr:pantetheine-phosphate adenylyltransferase [Myxococcota bacterium]
MTRVAIYAGSFDPITLGHLDVIRRGSGLFGRLVVAVGNNPAKRYLFTMDERVAQVREVCADLGNVEVVGFSGLLVDEAQAVGATVILRGLRALSDFEPELRNGLANRDLTGVETLFLLSSPEYVYVSSSLVKEIATNGGDASRYLPPPVAQAVARRCAGR